MFVLVTEPSVFWHDQCHNPHSRHFYSLYRETLSGWSEVHYSHTLGGWAVRTHAAARRLPNHYGAYGAALKPICRSEQIIVLCYMGSYADNTMAAARRAQLWAFGPVRAAALERYLQRYLRAVRALLRPHALGHKDIADMICACLRTWHAGLPREDPLC